MSKRTIQLAGIVTILAMSGGFALASINAPGTNQQVVTSNGTTSTTFQATGWSAAAPQQTAPTGLTAANLASPNACVDGLSSTPTPCVAGEQALGYSYTYSGGGCAPSPNDNFAVTTTASDSTTSATGTSSNYNDLTCTNFILWIDFGPHTDVVTVSAISVQVSGNS